MQNIHDVIILYIKITLQNPAVYLDNSVIAMTDNIYKKFKEEDYQVRNELTQVKNEHTKVKKEYA